LTGLGRINFEILRSRRVRVVGVAEPEILRAARFFLERMKLLVEPSAATVLAALRAEAARLPGRRVGAILSGGNTEVGEWAGN
jgi:threonine dehydratase